MVIDLTTIALIGGSILFVIIFVRGVNENSKQHGGGKNDKGSGSSTPPSSPQA